MEAGDIVMVGGRTWLVLWGPDEPNIALYPSLVTGSNPFLFVEVAEA